MIQRAVEDEFDAWLGRARYERRPDYQRGLRNGFRPSNILTAAALALCCALAATAAADPFTDAERKLVESPEVQGTVDRISSEIRATPAVVEVQAPSSGFDWGDAGIGAAGMLGLFSIAGGALLLATSRRRRRVSVAH